MEFCNGVAMGCALFLFFYGIYLIIKGYKIEKKANKIITILIIFAIPIGAFGVDIINNSSQDLNLQDSATMTYFEPVLEIPEIKEVVNNDQTNLENKLNVNCREVPCFNQMMCIECED